MWLITNSLRRESQKSRSTTRRQQKAKRLESGRLARAAARRYTTAGPVLHELMDAPATPYRGYCWSCRALLTILNEGLND